tara:strand:- start:455 stop:862 length:408 start_codon:yes stop_codon:yes gene_type:complete
MSEILTNKLTGTTTAGSILVTGEGNSTTTNLQQGLAKAWTNIDGEASGPASRDSFNVGTITDVSAGQINYAITSPMSDGDYCRLVSAGDNGVRRVADTGAASSHTTVLAVIITESMNGNLYDVDDANGAILGDLA